MARADFPFLEIRMRNVVTRRTAAHFGWDYDYERWGTVPGRPIPEGPRSAGAAEAQAGARAWRAACTSWSR